MLEFRVKLGQDGRIIIPAECRHIMHLSPGEELVLRIENDEATLFSLHHAIQKAKEIVKSHNKNRKSMVQELIKMRRDEGQHE